MANNKRTIYLGLDYSQFSGGITEINRKMGLLDAEFKLATQQAKNYGTETDELGLKEEYLTQKIALQTQKVEEAKRAYDAAMSSQQASQKEIDELDKRLLNERTKLEQLNGSLQQTKEDTEKADKANKTFGDTIRGLASALGLNISPALEAVAKKFDGISAATGTAIIGIGAMVSGFAKLSKETAAYADEIITLADQTGFTTEQIQRMQYACMKLDVEFSTVEGSISKLTTNMYKAQKGSDDLEKVFKKLHIRIKDGSGHLRDSKEVFFEAIDALGKMTNETEKDALAQQLFGKSAKELNTIIKAGSDQFKEYEQNAKKVMTDEQLNRANAYQEAMEELDETMETLRLSLGEALIPLLTAITNFFANIPAPMLRTITILAAFTAGIVLVAKAIASVKTIMTALSPMQASMQASGLKTVAIVLAITAALIALAAIIGVIIGKKEDIDQTLTSVQKSTAAMGQNVQNAQTYATNVARHASGADYYQGGRTWVGEEGPEIVELPRGSRIIPNKQASQISNATNNYYITIDAKNVTDFNRVVDMANQMQMATRRI
jgi:hypothetical protein